MPLIATDSAEAKALRGLHLYHFGMSNCSQRVRIVLHEKGLAWTSHHVDLSRDEHATPKFIAINPKGVVPVLVHDGQVIIESLDILAYIEDRFPDPPLVPSSAEDAALVAELSSLAASVQPALKLLSYEFLFKPKRRMSASQLDNFAASHSDAALVQFMRDFSSPAGFGFERIAEACSIMDLAFARLNKVLDDRKWLAGATFSLADIGWMPNVRRMAMMRFPMRKHASLSRWYVAIKTRKSFRAALLGFEPLVLRSLLRGYSWARRINGSHVAAVLARATSTAQVPKT